MESVLSHLLLLSTSQKSGRKAVDPVEEKAQKTWVQVLTLTPPGSESGQVSQAGSAAGGVHTAVAEATREYSPQGECPALRSARDPHASGPKHPLQLHQSLLLHLFSTCCLAVPVTSHVPPSFSFPNSRKVLPSSPPQYPLQESSPLCSALSLQSSIMSSPKGLLPTTPPTVDPKHTRTRTPRKPDLPRATLRRAISSSPNVLVI